MSNIDLRMSNVEGLGRSPPVRPMPACRLFTSTFGIQHSVFDVLPFLTVADPLPFGSRGLPLPLAAGPVTTRSNPKPMADPVHLPHELVEQLRDITPAEIIVFTADGCPHCPHGVRAAEALAAVSERVSTTVVDAEQSLELAAEFNVQSVPTVAVDRELVVTRVVPAEELAHIVLERGTDTHHQRVFDAHLSASSFGSVARLIAGSDRGPVCFAAAWRNSTMNTRMALMLVAEEALGADASALDGIAPELIAILDTDDAALRGDTVDLLGHIGHPSATEALKALCDDPIADVAEIAEEALGVCTGGREPKAHRRQDNS